MAPEGDYDPKSGKRSFGISVFLHSLVFLGVFLGAYLKFLFEPEEKPRPPDKIFEMISDAQVSQMREPAPPQPPAPAPPLKIEKPRDIKPVELPPAPLPEPDPAPSPQPLPEPPARPKPVKPKPSDTPKPQPKVSYEEFVKRQGRPQPRPAPPRANPKPVKLSQITVNSSRLAPQRSNASSYQGQVTQDEIRDYIMRIYAMAKQNWIAPAELAGMNLEAKVRLSVDSRGRVGAVRILASSGERAFDASIEKLFKSLSFIPPPRGEALSVDFVFVSID